MVLLQILSESKPTQFETIHHRSELLVTAVESSYFRVVLLRNRTMSSNSPSKVKSTGGSRSEKLLEERGLATTGLKGSYLSSRRARGEFKQRYNVVHRCFLQFFTLKPGEAPAPAEVKGIDSAAEEANQRKRHLVCFDFLYPFENSILTCLQPQNGFSAPVHRHQHHKNPNLQTPHRSRLLPLRLLSPQHQQHQQQHQQQQQHPPQQRPHQQRLQQSPPHRHSWPLSRRKHPQHPLPRIRQRRPLLALLVTQHASDGIARTLHSPAAMLPSARPSLKSSSPQQNPPQLHQPKHLQRLWLLLMLPQQQKARTALLQLLLLLPLRVQPLRL